MKWPRRGRGDSQRRPDPNGPLRGRRTGGRGKGLRRLVRADPSWLGSAAFTRPGRAPHTRRRPLARRSALNVSRSRRALPTPTSSRRILGRLYQRVADDVADELSTHGRIRRPTIVDLGCGPGDLAVEISRRPPRCSESSGWTSRQACSCGPAATPPRTDGCGSSVRPMLLPCPSTTHRSDLVVSNASACTTGAEPADAFAEIARVLKPDGIALIYDLGLLAFGAFGDGEDRDGGWSWAERHWPRGVGRRDRHAVLRPVLARRAGSRSRPGTGVRLRVGRLSGAPLPATALLRRRPAMLESRPL